jgi:hypothetical protein
VYEKYEDSIFTDDGLNSKQCAAVNTCRGVMNVPLQYPKPTRTATTDDGGLEHFSPPAILRVEHASPDGELPPSPPPLHPIVALKTEKASANEAIFIFIQFPTHPVERRAQPQQYGGLSYFSSMRKVKT